MVLYTPAPTTAAKLSQYCFFCCREFKFSTTNFGIVELAPTAAKLAVRLRSQMKAKRIFFTSHATNNGWNIVISIVYITKKYKTYTFEVLQFCIDLVEAQRGRSDYSNREGVRSKAIITSQSPALVGK